MSKNIRARVDEVVRATQGALQSITTIEDALWENASLLLQNTREKILTTGIGKSGYIAMKVAATLTSLGHVAIFVHPVEAMHGDSGIVGNGDVVVAFSYSGATKELVQFVRHTKQNLFATCIGITGSENSPLGILSDVVIPISILGEGCPLNLAPMASTTAMLVVGDALAASITSPEHFSERDFARFHPSGSLGLSLTTVKERMRADQDIVVKTDTPLQEVLREMNRIGKGTVGVISQEGILVGSITDGDVRRFFSTHDSCGTSCAHDVMSPDPKRILESDTLKDALTLMETHKITSLFVLNKNDRPIGILHVHDIIES